MPQQERMRLYFEERYGRGFEYAYVIPGMTRVVQSAGRVIRSETDVGVLALVCRRFLQNPYRKFLPTHWYDESPSELASPEPGETVRAFFAGTSLPERMQLAVEAGAKRILIPSENKRDVADVPDAILTAIQWQFYDSQTRAAILSMGLG